MNTLKTNAEHHFNTFWEQVRSGPVLKGLNLLYCPFYGQLNFTNIVDSTVHEIVQQDPISDTEQPSGIRFNIVCRDLVKSRSGEIGSLNYRITWKLDGRLGNSAIETSFKFQTDDTILNTNLAASGPYEILQNVVLSDIITRPWFIWIVRSSPIPPLQPSTF